MLLEIRVAKQGLPWEMNLSGDLLKCQSKPCIYVEHENSKKTIASTWGLQGTIRGSLCLVYVMVIVAKGERRRK